MINSERRWINQVGNGLLSGSIRDQEEEILFKANRTIWLEARPGDLSREPQNFPDGGRQILAKVNLGYRVSFTAQADLELWILLSRLVLLNPGSVGMNTAPSLDVVYSITPNK